MHELSIAQNIVEIASDSARQAGATKITEVRLKLGQFSGVVRSALDFCYEIATHDTLLEGSRLVVKELPIIIFCAHCQRRHELPDVQCFRCPACQTPSSDIRQGTELEIESIEIET